MVLKNTYKVKKHVQSGSYGKIFHVEDITQGSTNSKQMVIKFSKDYSEIAQEAKVLLKLKKMTESNDTGFPTPIAYGIFIASNIHQDEAEE